MPGSGTRPAAGRRDALRSIGATVLALGGAELACGASVVGVRVWPADDYTRVTIESDAALTARHFLAEGPDRLVIDIEGLELGPALRELVGKVQADDPYIAGVRAGQNLPRVVRIVIDLKQPTTPEVFTLAPVAAYRHRLVFDLHPAREPDPLLALIRDKANAEQQVEQGVAQQVAQGVTQEVHDALGEFIGRVDRPAPVPSIAAASGGAGSVGAVARERSAAAAGQGTRTPTTPMSAPVPAAIPTPMPSPPQVALAPEIATGGAGARPSGAAPVVPPALQNRIDRLIVIAIDPGHGGEDPGASGATGLHEKDVVLQIALQLRDRINGLPNMRAFLTRDADFFVPLHERVRKAQRVQADLFVSIHADAFVTPEARGASVFALSQGGATSAAARWMAQRENAADAVGGVNRAARDPGVLRALADMSTSAQIRDSMKLGDAVLGEIGRIGRLHRGSVEQAGFAVLKAPEIPSILVESAFISNPDEEARLRDPAYQAQLVQAVAAGIQRYFARHPPLARSRQL